MKQMRTTSFFLFIILMPFSVQAFVQKGQVVDSSNEPLIGVSVIIKGTSEGVSTDVDGLFSIKVKNKYILDISYIGFETSTYVVDTLKNDVKIVLKESATHLDEIVVTGYGLTEKRTLTGSLSTISDGRIRGSDVSMESSDADLDASQVGLLTAGELNDFSKWMMWDSIANNDFVTYRDIWNIKPLERYVAQLTNKKGMPIVNATVILSDAENKLIWETKTDNAGRAELWANVFDTQGKELPTSIYFEYEGKDTLIMARPFSQGINTASLDVNCNRTQNVDLMMIVDATGSMGDEITYLQNELHDILNKIQKEQSSLDIRVGSVFYRDTDDEYLTRKSALDKDVTKTINFIQQQMANGGGDYPEALDEALYQAIELEDWRTDALARVAFIVLDAPAHAEKEKIAKIQQQVALAAEKGIRLVPIVCSGIDKSGEYLLRSMALATNGTYVFLTDDSGIGGSHLKPTTDKYEVESLNALIIRLVMQYTQMPDCDTNKWIKEYKKEQNNDKFIPNPYDEDADEDDLRLKLGKVIKVYPNPCDSELKIDIKQDVQDVSFVDISGKLLQNFNSKKGETLYVDVSHYSAGVYFVKANHKGKWYTEKIIVK